MCSVLSRNILNLGRFFYKSSPTYTCKVLEFSRITPVRLYSSDKVKKSNLFEENEIEEEPNLPTSVKSDYQAFRDEDSPIILDVDEEKKKLDLETINAMENVRDPYEGLNMKRGVEGVFDIADLVDLLRKDKAQKIFVSRVPREWSYVDYIVVVTGRSYKHMSALATLVRKAYKLKKNDDDLIPKIEGEKSNDWVALDLGNIALHIFSSTARELYDLETLWAIGPAYDKQLLDMDSTEELENKYMKLLEGLQPADDPPITRAVSSSSASLKDCA